MIRSKVTAKNRGQKGYTLIEVILAIALIAMLSGGITAFLIQTIKESDKVNDRMQVVMQVENVGYWVSRDVQMTENLTTGLNAGFPLTLEWKDVDQNTFLVTYLLAEGQIKRNLLKNGQQESLTLIADSINSDPTFTNFIYADGLLTFNITANFRSDNVSRTYQIKKRLDLI